MSITEQFRTARDQLVALREGYKVAREEFNWPQFEHFNFALDWFDQVAASEERKDALALVIAEQDGSHITRTFGELSRRSSQAATWLRSLGVQRGDRIILMLGNQVELWETMLAGIKLGAVQRPRAVRASSLREDSPNRATRGHQYCR